MIEKLVVKRKKGQGASATAPRAARREDTLPQSPDAEKAVLSSLLQDCGRIPDAGRILSKAHFANPVHGDIYTALCRAYSDEGQFDLVTFTQYLGDRKLLQKVGGAGYVTELFGFTQVPDMLPHYAGILQKKFILRQMIQVGLMLQRRAFGALDDEEGAALAEALETLDKARRYASGGNGSERFEFQKLMGFDSKHDPNCLVGNRYLVRGGSSLWAGGSGYGKSSLALQLALYWACGESCFGLRPVRPLKSLIVQAENDEGDTAEQLQGVLQGIASAGDLDMAASKDLIEKNIGIHRVVGKTGDMFLGLLSELIDYDKPDVVWPDPLFAFAGCDLMNAEKTGRFLREGLFPIAGKFNVAMNVVHHVGKPVRDKDSDSSHIAEIDFQYLGFGTSEIQNAFRAVNILVPVSGTPGLFRLVLSKRGERAGAKDTKGEWARSIYLRHSTEGICWLQSDKPEKQTAGAAKLKYSEQHILDAMSIVHGVSARAFQKSMKDETGMSEPTFYRLWDTLKSSRKIILDKEGKWIRKPKVELKT